MLVKSAQLARSWTTRPMRELSSINIKLGQPLAITPTKLISGRWLVGCEHARRFILHDADPCAETHARKVLWEHDEPIVSAWDVHSMSPIAGQSAVYVYLELPEREDGSFRKLLEFCLNDESGEIYDSATIDPPAWAWNDRCWGGLRSGKARFLFIPMDDLNGVVFDTRTRLFYAVPHWRVALPETLPEQFHGSFGIFSRMVFTDTHILSLYQHHQGGSDDYATLIQFFAIPSDGSLTEDGLPTLYLTHEGFSKHCLVNVSITKSDVDSVTGVTNMRLLGHRFSTENLTITWVDLVLQKPRTHEVLPISLDDMTMNNIQILRGFGTSRYPHCTEYLDVGDKAQLRGFCRGSPIVTYPMESQQTIKFAVDMRQDPWAVTYSEMAPAEWHDAGDLEVDTATSSIVFDGLRGRLCYIHPKVEEIVVVVDIE